MGECIFENGSECILENGSKSALKNGSECILENGSFNSGEQFFKLLSSKSKRVYHKTFCNYISHGAMELGEDQPFYTMDLADILWKVQMWNEKFPNVLPVYAVKANADPVLVRLLVLLGFGFDVSTEPEIRLVTEAGADPKKLIFAHTCKIPRALHYASSMGCDLLTFDCKEELLKINKHFPRARLIIRIKSPSMQTVYNLSTKFGCEEREAEDLLLTAKQLNLDVVGVSFHVGALCDDPKTYTSTIESCASVFKIAKRVGYQMTIMDIGAGFFGSTEREGFFHTLSQEINKSLEENFPDKNTTFIAEPGCYYVGSAVTLTTTVIGKKDISKKENNKTVLQREYFLNDGLYGSFFDHQDLYDIKPTPLIKASELRKRQICRSKLWGQTCCAQDMVMEDCSLPDMEVGELIVWSNMGAYRKERCSVFTGVTCPETRHAFIQNKRLRLDWITNVEEVSSFIAEVADLVESEVLSE